MLRDRTIQDCSALVSSLWNETVIPEDKKGSNLADILRRGAQLLNKSHEMFVAVHVA